MNKINNGYLVAFSFFTLLFVLNLFVPDQMFYGNIILLFFSTGLVLKFYRTSLFFSEQNKKLHDINSSIIADKIIKTDFEDYTKLSGSPIHLLCEGIFKQIDSVGAKNFYEMKMKNATTGEEFEIFFQKVGGETPLDQLVAARNEIEKLKKEIQEKSKI